MSRSRPAPRALIFFIVLLIPHASGRAQAQANPMEADPACGEIREAKALLKRLERAAPKPVAPLGPGEKAAFVFAGGGFLALTGTAFADVYFHASLRTLGGILAGATAAAFAAAAWVYLKGSGDTADLIQEYTKNPLGLVLIPEGKACSLILESSALRERFHQLKRFMEVWEADARAAATVRVPYREDVAGEWVSRQSEAGQVR